MDRSSAGAAVNRRATGQQNAISHVRIKAVALDGLWLRIAFGIVMGRNDDLMTDIPFGVDPLVEWVPSGAKLFALRGI